jgi:beta-glucosidase-like glycosyl hydrolase
LLVCGKHFPGLGDTHLDSHLDLPVVHRSWRTLQQSDLVPYKKLLNELAFIMVNHALYPQKNKKLPASLSKEIVEKVLLEDWNYQGLAISDDLHMGAISKIYNLPEAAEHALSAGNELFLICRPEGVVEAYKKLLRRADHDSKLAAKIYQSGSRLLAAKFQMIPNPPKSVNIRKEIRRMNQYSLQAAEQAITLLQGEPLKKIPEELTVYLPRTKWLRNELSVFGAYTNNQGCNITERFYAPGIIGEDAARHAHASATEWNLVITADRGANPGQAILLEELLRRGKKLLLIEGAMPELPLPENIFVAVASYWTPPVALHAAWKRITGERQASGRLPLQRGRTLV